MIIFLFGEDTWRSRQKLKELKDKFLRDVDASGSSLTVVDGRAALLKDLKEAISASSLLARKRLVIIEEIFSNKSTSIFVALNNYLADRRPVKNDNIIIFWDSRAKTKKTKNKEELLFTDSAGRDKPLAKAPLGLFKFLLKQKYTQQFNQLSNTAATNWAKKEIERRGGKISLPATQLLTSLVGGDLWQLNNEIDKLLNYKLASQPKLTESKETVIETSDVEKLVRGSFDENIFALTDAISIRNKALAAKLLEEQIEAGLTNSYLLNMFTRQFRILLQIKQALVVGHSPRKISSELKIHPFVAQKGVSQASHFSLPQLKNILNQLVNIDYQMKSGGIGIETALNLLIAKI